MILTDVSRISGLPAASGPCLLFRDFNNDGRPDLALSPVSADGATSQLAIYRNDGGGHFTPVRVGPSFDFLGNCASGDLDNDGFPDLLLTASPASGNHEQRLYFLRNKGTGNFDFEDRSDLVSPALPIAPWALGVFDADRDGWLDVYVGATFANQLEHGLCTCSETADDFSCVRPEKVPVAPSVLLHNRNGQKLEPETLGGSTGEWVVGAGFYDWDGDGYPDLFEIVNGGPNRFRKNLGGKGFGDDLLAPLHANPYNHGMGVAFGDFDDDGTWDFYVADLGPDQFYFGNSSGGLDERNTQLGLTKSPARYHSSWSPAAADFNNDGLLDVYVTNTCRFDTRADFDQLLCRFSGETTAEQMDFLLENRGGGDFAIQQVKRAQQHPTVAQGVTAVADFDGDGFLDLAQVTFGDAFDVRLFRNDTALKDAHFLKVELQGKRNRFAVGAVVTIHQGGKAIGRRIVEPAGLTSSDGILHFGLGKRTSVDAIHVRWPDGPDQDVAGPIRADQTFKIAQP